MEQVIQFCTARDGVRIAYAKHGSGPPLVKAANWLTHIEYDWHSPLMSHWMRELGRRFTVIRYDERCCGLSDPDVERLDLEAFVSDLEAVVDAAGVERFVLLAISQGGGVAATYAARHPERVEGIVFIGSYVRGRLRRDSEEAREEHAARVAVARVGWGRPDPAFRSLFGRLMIPDASPDLMEAFDELQRQSTTPANAVRLMESWARIDARAALPRVTAPALVLHARDDRAVPFAEGRLIASGIANARLVPLEGRNHLLLADEEAWTTTLDEIDRFTGAVPAADRTFDLSARELDVLELVAAGLGNEQIAERLVLSVRTVERHLSNIYVKLGLSGKAGRAAAAARFSEFRSSLRST